MMKHICEVEIRETAGRDPMLHATILTEGRAASGGRAEVFAPGAVQWPSDGVGIAVGHRGETETRGYPVRQRDGRLTVTARATESIKRAVEAGAKYMSVEFNADKERRTQGGVREVLQAMVMRAALVENPEYDTTAAEVRSQKDDELRRRVMIWL